MLPMHGGHHLALLERETAASPEEDLIPLASSAVEASMSSYLRDGWRREEVFLERVACGSGRTRGHIAITDGAVGADGQFHLSALHVTVWIQQLGVIHVCRQLGATKDEIGEVYLRKLALRFRRAIRDPSNIIIELRQTSPRTVGGMYVCPGTIDVCDGAIVGDITAVAALPPGRQA